MKSSLNLLFVLWSSELVSVDAAIDAGGLHWGQVEGKSLFLKPESGKRKIETLRKKDI